MTALGEADVLVAVAGELCEGPCWDTRTGRLVWVDIMAGRIHVADPDTGEHETTEIGMPVGSVAPRRSGGWVAAVERGFVLLDDDWRPLGPVVPAPEQPAGSRFNDGRCDPAGRFWAGTMAYDTRPGAAALYRFDGGDAVELVLSDVTISNGIGWSLDARTMYYVDTGPAIVDRMAYDLETGTPRDRQTLLSASPDDGAPDGLTIDAEGHLWVAMWDGGCVRRYSPEGELEEVVRLPVSRPTSMAFGGERLDELFITTAYEGLTPQQRAEQPLAGSVFRHRPGVTGRLPDGFRG